MATHFPVGDVSVPVWDLRNSVESKVGRRAKPGHPSLPHTNYHKEPPVTPNFALTLLSISVEFGAITLAILLGAASARKALAARFDVDPRARKALGHLATCLLIALVVDFLLALLSLNLALGDTVGVPREVEETTALVLLIAMMGSLPIAGYFAYRTSTA